MKECTQLTLPRGDEMSKVHRVGQGPKQIARISGVHRTTIPNKLKRNISPNDYYPQAGYRRSLR